MKFDLQQLCEFVLIFILILTRIPPLLSSSIVYFHHHHQVASALEQLCGAIDLQSQICHRYVQIVHPLLRTAKMGNAKNMNIAQNCTDMYRLYTRSKLHKKNAKIYILHKTAKIRHRYENLQCKLTRCTKTAKIGNRKKCTKPHQLKSIITKILHRNTCSKLLKKKQKVHKLNTIPIAHFCTSVPAKQCTKCGKEH